MKTNIFILHYEDDTLTDQCVLSLLDQAEVCGATIFVVDNGSPIPYRTEYPVKIMRFDENLFLVTALSKAMQMNPAGLYGLLNNDLICGPDLISTMSTLFRDADIGIAAPGSSDYGAGILYVPFAAKWGNVETEAVDNHCFWAAGDVVALIGWPDVEGHTDHRCWAWNRAYCHMAREAGYKVIAARDAYVQHLGGGYNAEADTAGRQWLAKRFGAELAAVL